MAVDAHTPHLPSFVVLITCFALKSGRDQGLIIAEIFFSASLHEKKLSSNIYTGKEVPGRKSKEARALFNI